MAVTTQNRANTRAAKRAIAQHQSRTPEQFDKDGAGVRPRGRRCEVHLRIRSGHAAAELGPAVPSYVP